MADGKDLRWLARVKDWWHQYSGAIPEWFQFYVGLEAAASATQEYNAELVTGLLQTEPYARAVMAAAMRADTDEEETERQIAVRLQRQKRLTGQHAPALWAVMNEAVLRRQVGGPQIMAGQLAHIGQLAARPGVTVQVLPFTAGAHPAMLGTPAWPDHGHGTFPTPSAPRHPGPVFSHRSYSHAQGCYPWYPPLGLQVSSIHGNGAGRVVAGDCSPQAWNSGVASAQRRG